MPKADMHHTTSRRALLAGAALVAPAALLPAIAAAAEVPRLPNSTAGQAPDPHPAWFAEWKTYLNWCNTADVGGRELVEFPQWHRLDELEGLIHGTPPRTLAGVAA